MTSQISSLIGTGRVVGSSAGATTNGGGGGLAVKKVGGLTLAAPAKIGLLKPKAFGISLAGFAGGMSDNIVEKPQLTKTLQVH